MIPEKITWEIVKALQFRGMHAGLALADRV
jgi:hypothetical protein